VRRQVSQWQAYLYELLADRFETGKPSRLRLVLMLFIRTRLRGYWEIEVCRAGLTRGRVPYVRGKRQFRLWHFTREDVCIAKAASRYLYGVLFGCHRVLLVELEVGSLESFLTATMRSEWRSFQRDNAGDKHSTKAHAGRTWVVRSGPMIGGK